MTDRRDDPPPLVEGLDYYVEDGMWVFTAYYLEKRGFCCDSGCRHCPYPDASRSAAVEPPGGG